VSNLRWYWDRYHEEYDEKLIFGIEYHDILKGSPYNIMWKYKKHKYVLVNTPTGIGIYYIDGENIEPADGPDSELLYKKVVKKMLAEGNKYYESIEELKRERGLNG
jgi:hypothetical protein